MFHLPPPILLFEKESKFFCSMLGQSHQQSVGEAHYLKIVFIKKSYFNQKSNLYLLFFSFFTTFLIRSAIDGGWDGSLVSSLSLSFKSDIIPNMLLKKV